MELEILKYVGAGLMAFGMMGAAIGIGLIFSGAASGVARNPAAQDKIFKTALIGAVFAELMGLFSFVGIFILLFIK